MGHAVGGHALAHRATLDRCVPRARPRAHARERGALVAAARAGAVVDAARARAARRRARPRRGRPLRPERARAARVARRSRRCARDRHDRCRLHAGGALARTRERAAHLGRSPHGGDRRGRPALRRPRGARERFAGDTGERPRRADRACGAPAARAALERAADRSGARRGRHRAGSARASSCR